MELDKTSIVLRQRSLLELIDLSLVVVRVFWRPLCFIGAIGVLPFFVLNLLILWPMADYERLLTYNYEFIEESPLRRRYLFFHMALILLESPIAFLGVTFFLGQSVFFEKPSMRDFQTLMRKSWLSILWILGGTRMLFVALVASFYAARAIAWSPGIEIFWLGMVVGGLAVGIRFFRPFAPELLVLERTPLRTSKEGPNSGVMHYSRRSRWLQRTIASELFGRSLSMAFAMLCLLISLTLAELFFSGIFLGKWQWNTWMDIIVFPLNVWVVALWGCVFRLLSYLDCRTRLEGWELELRLRAEAARLSGKEAAYATLRD